MSIFRGSRYQDARPFTPDEQGTVFPGVRPRVIPATPGLIEHELQLGERLDSLAHNYFTDGRRWWRIADANPAALFGEDLIYDYDPDAPEPVRARVGAVVLIPRRQDP